MPAKLSHRFRWRIFRGGGTRGRVKIGGTIGLVQPLWMYPCITHCETMAIIVPLYTIISIKHKVACFKGNLLSNVGLQQRLYGVKGVEEGNSISSLTTAEIERWILWVLQWLTWPVCRFSGQARQPSDYRYLLFLWQLGKRCACRQVHYIWRFSWPLPGSPLHLPLWQCRQCAILH